ncbi:galactose-1-phosphate uridylyltransferase [Arthrobacter caoxuetaonis]|uniref:Galactose-1-phosphate uridylyltransferase n=1 Tax=Arthrobacter caoxuetaonis TaxID=2886935 RepID=A0A9X1MFL2_9MICC|nr:galactose-1-phosphate uridylyltransferase [Arthrobacter caoxuetaonis]MCC3298911.1 galactose-1-phosphate uridylyltransferase [Arthrobacter caoxuetaonis]USQ58743.1 galactose-1-phosphate uridylyltransferase [Arthrobacter caoxuetaonis]
MSSDRRASVPVRTRLADGRELLYFFDGDGGRPHASLPEDTRELPARPATPELRYDRLLGEWVSYAAHRQSRTHLPPARECPLCPSSDTRATEIPAPDYDVAVFENRFPAFGPETGGALRPPDWAFEEFPAVGRCEVVAFSADHAASFPGLTRQRVRTVIDAWTHRTAELSRLAGVGQVFIFENRGAEIGVTLHHPHGQIYAYPFPTPRTLTQLESARRYRAEGRGELFADLLADELADGRRIVARGRYWTAYVPYAARMPLEVHVVPHRSVPDLPALSHEEREELSGLYLDVLQRIEALYPTPTPYIAAWYQAPVNHPLRGQYRVHLQVTSPRRAAGKLKYLAGSEAAMGAFIGDVIPEDTAERLRGALPPFAASRAAEDEA